MSNATIEHVNLTVRDPHKTAAMLCDLFGWKIRWEGDSINEGHSVHVGTENTYLAVYTMPGSRASKTSSYAQVGGLNHLGIQVDDLEAVEQRIKAAGYRTYNFGDYEPGRRFYFRDDDNIEYEALSYARGTRA